MHELFANVLAKRDLSRAGDLFSISDEEIVETLSEVLLEIANVISQPDYLKNTNDQSVIEICVTRVTSCIRETNSVERHCEALVTLLDTCSQFNHRPSKRNEEPPHAKISSDIISSIFLNYNKKNVMEIALPVAVKFLNKDNKELSRNLASYLSLVSIEFICPYVNTILDSLLSGNYSLSRVILQLYDIASETINQATRALIDVLQKCDTQDKNNLLQLIATIIKSNSSTNNIIDKLPQFFDLILIPTAETTATAALTVLLRLAEKKPLVFLDYIDLLILTAQKLTSTICLVGQILSAIGRKNKEKAQVALDFILENLQNTDRASQTTLLHEAVKLCTQYPILFNDKLTAVIRQRNLSQQNLLSNKTANAQTSSGNVTIVKLNTSANTLSSRLEQNQMQQQQEKAPSKSQVTVINTSNGQTSSNHLPLILPSQFAGHGHQEKTYSAIPGPPPHSGYTRRAARFGDSRSTGRLHGGVGSMTRLNAASGVNVNNVNLGGLHKSMTRLSSSQQINEHSSNNFITLPPPLSQHVTITGENKWGIPSTKITSGGVTVNITPRQRPFSQGPSTMMGALGKSSSNGLSILNQSTGSISAYNGTNNPSIASSSTQNNKNSIANNLCNNYGNNNQQSTSSLLPIAMPALSSTVVPENQVVVNGPTVNSRKNGNKSVTMLNVSVNHRMSVFEPSPMRDTIQHFCEKHLKKIQSYMQSVSCRLPTPIKLSIEEKCGKKFAKLSFACQCRGTHCLYSKTFFNMRTRNAKTWIHLMFLDLQSRASNALSSWDPSVSSLKHCWDTLKFENKTFITLVTSAFPHPKDQETLLNELRNSGFFDVFEIGASINSSNSLDEEPVQQWGCFLCRNPDKAIGFLENNTQPVIEGQLKEKKGKWRLFRRWRTRYFTLSGAHLSCKGSSANIDINQIRSVKVSRGARNIPKAFEIFTGDQTLILKPKDGEKAEEWVQALSVVVAQARDCTTKTNSLPASSRSRTVF